MFAHARRRYSAVVLLSALLSAAALPAAARERSTLKEFLFGTNRAPAPPASARYAVDADGVGFVLDAAPGKTALLKIDGNPEIWALRPTRGPRGDVIYKNDMDQPVVRATRLGGLTYFTSDQPEGLPAALVGQASPPRIPVELGPEMVLNVFMEASARASRAAQRLVVFEGPSDLTAATAPVFADAAVVASQAFARVVAQSRDGRLLVARFSRVQFNSGRGPGAAAFGEVIRITVCPQDGVAGRPSSDRIASVIARR